MSNEQKFEGFKQQMIEENEQKYGAEVREKYGDAVVDRSNKKLQGMTAQDWQKVEALQQELADKLKQAVAETDPAGALAQEVCDLHRQWLCFFWPDGHYSKQAHASLGEMYVADERFKAYYDGIAPNAAEFLRGALQIYCKV